MEIQNKLNKMFKKNRETETKSACDILFMYSVSSFLEYCILIGCNFFVQMSLCEITEFAIFFAWKIYQKHDATFKLDLTIFSFLLHCKEVIVLSRVPEFYSTGSVFIFTSLFMSLFNLLVQVNLNSRLVLHFYLHIYLK